MTITRILSPWSTGAANLAAPYSLRVFLLLLIYFIFIVKGISISIISTKKKGTSPFNYLILMNKSYNIFQLSFIDN